MGRNCWLRQLSASSLPRFQPCRWRLAAMANFVMDRKQLIHTVGAGMTIANCLPTVFNEGRRQARLGEDPTQLLSHFGAVAGDEEILSGREQVFGIFPRRANQWNAARQCFERADRRNPRQRSHIRTSGHVNGDAMFGEHAWRLKICQPTAILNARLLERLLRGLRVTNAIDLRLQPEFLARLDQEFEQLSFPLAVSPIADPNQIANFLDSWPGVEHTNIRCLVPGPRAFGRAWALIQLLQHSAVGEH